MTGKLAHLPWLIYVRRPPTPEPVNPGPEPDEVDEAGKAKEYDDQRPEPAHGVIRDAKALQQKKDSKENNGQAEQPRASYHHSVRRTERPPWRWPLDLLERRFRRPYPSRRYASSRTSTTWRTRPVMPARRSPVSSCIMHPGLAVATVSAPVAWTAATLLSRSLRESSAWVME